MQKVLTAYTMYFNKKNNRTGALFAGRFKARHANSDEYLKYLISYIHLNPVKMIEPKWKDVGIRNMQKARTFLEEYRFSSYAEYAGQIRPESNIIDKKTVPEYFSQKNTFKRTIRDWLTYKENPEKIHQGSTSLNTSRFNLAEQWPV